MANSLPAGYDVTQAGRNAAYILIDGVATGYTQDGLSILPSLGLSAVQFNEDASPQGSQVDTQELTIDVTLAEVTNANLKKYLASLAEISGSALYYGDKKGNSLDTFEVKMFPLHPDGHPYAGRVFTFFKCTVEPNGAHTINPQDSGFEGLPIKIKILKDSTKSAGREFFSLDAVDTTAPTVSSTSPADAATGVAVDAAVTVTFSKAMSLSSFIENQTVKIIDPTKSSNAYTEVIDITAFSLNAALTTLTISHADFSNSTAYTLELQNVKSADGVALAAPYITVFTTTS